MKTHAGQLMTRNLAGDRNLQGQRDLAGQNAAYAAHFLADMFVPYHVIGMSRQDLKDLIQNRGGGDVTRVVNLLTTEVYGDEVLRNNASNQTHSFIIEEVKRFLASQDDWFAPFYYNGTQSGRGVRYLGDSSHILWEWLVYPEHTSIANAVITGTSPTWKNYPIPQGGAALADFFARPGTHANLQAELFTKEAARATRGTVSNINNNGYITGQFLDAIKAVYTLWRSTFSALKPLVNETEGQGFWNVTTLIGSTISERPRNVIVRLTSSTCTIDGPEFQPAPGQWKVTGKPMAPCAVTLEAVGTYTTPDLQYARYEHNLGVGRSYTSRPRSAVPGVQKSASPAPKQLPGAQQFPQSPQAPVPHAPQIPQNVQDGLDTARKAFDFFLKR